MKRAGSPFRFFSRLSLAVATGRKARDVSELRSELERASDREVYHHTHRFLQEHQYLVPEPPNDFAYWVSEIVGDQLLGERLSAVDTVRHETLSSLKTALLAVIEKHLKDHPGDHKVFPGEEFHFQSAIRFSVPSTRVAWDLVEFRDHLKKISMSSLYLHVFEARLRPPLGRNDFSIWLEKELDESILSQRMETLDPYSHTLEDLRGLLVGFLDERISHEVG